jgi:probable F420-dependent oxidoreductase
MALLIDANLRSSFESVSDTASRAEKAGFSGYWCPEATEDPFTSVALAAQRTSAIQLGTGVAIALSRTPMHVAYAAYNLQRLTGGRFYLGLGSQIRPHIQNRFSMPWSRPAARMRDFVGALHAVWDAWDNGTRLAYRGEFYTHTLMTPEFTPEMNPFGRPQVYMAAVGPVMLRVCGEVADGLVVHPFATRAYINDFILPAVSEGRTLSGKSMEGFSLSLVSFIALNDVDLAAARDRIAFYASTPAYRPVLELHGYEDLQEELNKLSKLGRWDDMSHLIDDNLLSLMCLSGTPKEVAAQLRSQYGSIAQRVTLHRPAVTDPSDHAELVAALRAEFDMPQMGHCCLACLERPGMLRWWGEATDCLRRRQALGHLHGPGLRSRHQAFN